MLCKAHNKTGLVTKYFPPKNFFSPAVIKVEGWRRCAGICGYKFLVRILSEDQMAGLQPNWICPRRDHVSSRPTAVATSLGCHSTNQRRLPYHLNATNLKTRFRIRFMFDFDSEIRMKGVRFEAINRSKGTVVVVSRVKNRDSENLLGPSEASKSCSKLPK